MLEEIIKEWLGKEPILERSKMITKIPELKLRIAMEVEKFIAKKLPDDFTEEEMDLYPVEGTLWYWGKHLKEDLTKRLTD